AAIFGDLLGVSEPSTGPTSGEERAALDPDLPAAERTAALHALGLFDPVSALAELERPARRAGSPFAASGLPPRQGHAASFLDGAVRSPDPAQALRHLAAFASALRNPAPYFAVLREVPRIGRLLVQLFGTSDFLSRYFLRHPELVDPLIRGESSVAKKGEAR